MAKLRHIAISVKDPEKTAKFFEQAFGMTRAGNAMRGVYLTDGTGQVTSPTARIGSRLVASNVTSGHEPSTALTKPAHASSRCSQLSNTNSVRRVRRNPTIESMVDCPG